MPVSPSVPGRKAPAPTPALEDGAEPPPRLAHLPARDKLDRLLRVAKGRRRALIVTHDNPDPDSIAAAVALGHVLEECAGVETEVGYGGIIGRAENIAFV